MSGIGKWVINLQVTVQIALAKFLLVGTLHEVCRRPNTIYEGGETYSSVHFSQTGEWMKGKILQNPPQEILPLI
jgi:hypothetical protein